VLQQSDLATMGDLEKNKDLFHDAPRFSLWTRSERPCFCWPEAMIAMPKGRKLLQVVDAVKKARRRGRIQSV